MAALVFSSSLKFFMHAAAIFLCLFLTSCYAEKPIEARHSNTRVVNLTSLLRPSRFCSRSSKASREASMEIIHKYGPCSDQLIHGKANAQSYSPQSKSISSPDYWGLPIGLGRIYIIKIVDSGRLLTLNLDKASGSGFQSRKEYLFGKIDMQLKLVPGNSAGTVTAYYLSSKGSAWDEIDFEFLGNLSGDPYIVHTNVFSQGKGNREQQFHLWFDPTADFHTYSILWNPQRIIFSVDGTPIREFKNSESKGVPFPKDQPMRIHSSLWNADDWATRGGLVKTDWSHAPFTASYRNFNDDNACFWANGASSCGASSSSSSSTTNAWLTQELDTTSQQRLKWVQNNYMIYNYCTDTKRFPQGLPTECNDS